ncbi:MAG: hypothetical protein QOG67_1773 [Verrucomicrobiota bacterium]
MLIEATTIASNSLPSLRRLARRGCRRSLRVTIISIQDKPRHILLRRRRIWIWSLPVNARQPLRDNWHLLKSPRVVIVVRVFCRFHFSVMIRPLAPSGLRIQRCAFSALALSYSPIDALPSAIRNHKRTCFRKINFVPGLLTPQSAIRNPRSTIKESLWPSISASRCVHDDLARGRLAHSSAWFPAP